MQCSKDDNDNTIKDFESQIGYFVKLCQNPPKLQSLNTNNIVDTENKNDNDNDNKNDNDNDFDWNRDLISNINSKWNELEAEISLNDEIKSLDVRKQKYFDLIVIVHVKNQ